jgi:hypothetical protein
MASFTGLVIESYDSPGESAAETSILDVLAMSRNKTQRPVSVTSCEPRIGQTKNSIKMKKIKMGTADVDM